MSGWRYFATRLHGDGTETLIADELPLTDVEFTRDLTGPSSFSAVVGVAEARLREGGFPIFVPWNTAVYAERDGHIHGAGIVASVELVGAELAFDSVGWAGYPSGQPWIGDRWQGVGLDVFDVVRRVWAHLQGHKGGNIGLKVDDAKAGLTVGVYPDDVYIVQEDDGWWTVAYLTGVGMDRLLRLNHATLETPLVKGRVLRLRPDADLVNTDDFETPKDSNDYTEGPFRLAEWTTPDLGKLLDDLAADVGFDWRERHSFAPDGTIRHELDLAPRIGRRRHDLRFVEGENILEVPALDLGGDEYATAALVVGAGEGRHSVRGAWSRDVGLVRRARAFLAKDVTAASRAQYMAERLVQRAGATVAVKGDFIVKHHPHAPLGSYDLGDEVLVRSAGEWTPDLLTWHRIVSIAVDPATDTAHIRTIHL